MSKIYLPNGGQIIIHKENWSQTTDSNGNLTIKEQSSNNFWGKITQYGVAHISNRCPHTYLPPEIKSITKAHAIINDNIKDLSHDQLVQLKRMLDKYNAKSGFWK